MDFSNKQEGTIEIIAALIVLFSAMISAQASLVLSVCALILFGLYKLMKKN